MLLDNCDVSKGGRLLSLVQNYVDSLAGSDKESVLELLQSCGLSEVMQMCLSREIGRHDNREA